MVTMKKSPLSLTRPSVQKAATRTDANAVKQHEAKEPQKRPIAAKKRRFMLFVSPAEKAAVLRLAAGLDVTPTALIVRLFQEFVEKKGADVGLIKPYIGPPVADRASFSLDVSDALLRAVDRLVLNLSYSTASPRGDRVSKTALMMHLLELERVKTKRKR